MIKPEIESFTFPEVGMQRVGRIGRIAMIVCSTSEQKASAIIVNSFPLEAARSSSSGGGEGVLTSVGVLGATETEAGDVWGERSTAVTANKAQRAKETAMQTLTDMLMPTGANDRSKFSARFPKALTGRNVWAK